MSDHDATTTNPLALNITPEWVRGRSDREPESGIVSARGGRFRCDNCGRPTDNTGDHAAGIKLCDDCKADPSTPPPPAPDADGANRIAELRERLAHHDLIRSREMDWLAYHRYYAEDVPWLLARLAAAEAKARDDESLINTLDTVRSELAAELERIADLVGYAGAKPGGLRDAVEAKLRAADVARDAAVGALRQIAERDIGGTLSTNGTSVSAFYMRKIARAALAAPPAGASDGTDSKGVQR